MISVDDLHLIIDELLKQLGLDLKTEVVQDEELYLVNLIGGDGRYFEHSRDNRTSALLVVLKLMVNKKHGIEPKIALDFNGQRKQRLQNVALMAKKTAEMVRVKGEEEELPPMTPAERRAVHMELKKMSGIRTESRGVEPHRRIVIIIDEEI
jgi:spoIIIJ-associated protein